MHFEDFSGTILLVKHADMGRERPVSLSMAGVTSSA